MRVRSWHLLVVVCLASCALVGAQPNCKKLAIGNDVFDLTPLMKAPGPFQAFAGNDTYEFRVCGNLKCSGTISAACQVRKTPPSHTLGAWGMTTTVSYRYNALVFNYPPLGIPLRGSNITVICDPRATLPTNPGVIPGDRNAKPPIAQLFITHQSACSKLAPFQTFPFGT